MFTTLRLTGHLVCAVPSLRVRRTPPTPPSPQQRGPLAESGPHEYEWGSNTRGRVRESDDSARKEQSIYRGVRSLSPATDMIKWPHLNMSVCKPRSVSHQMDMNNVLIACPPVAVYTTSSVCVVLSRPSWQGHRGGTHIMSQSQERCGCMFTFHHQSTQQTV